MRDSIKVFQLTEVEQFGFVTLPVPEPGEGEVLIRRLAVAICNAMDLYLYRGTSYPNKNKPMTYPAEPGRPGHEWVGIVEQLGSGVKSLKTGDWVSLPGDRGEGRDMYPRGYAPYSVCNETRLIRVPAGMAVAQLAPVEMAICVAANMFDLKYMNAIKGKRVGVMGLGPAGLIAAQMLRAEGAKEVVGLDIEEKRRTYAISTGQVDDAIDPQGEDGRKRPYRRSRNAGVIETGIDCASVPEAIEYLMDHTRDLVSLFAVQHGPVEFRGWPLGHHQGLKLHGTPNRSYACGDYVVSMIESGKLHLNLLISHRMRLGEYHKAIELISSREAVKVLFTFDEKDW
jgi:threonine dehydrogenase-like Zn-dependent dehydrogenase